MSHRMTHTAGVAVGWLLVAGVAAALAPEAAHQARELGAELQRSIRRLLRRDEASPAS